MSRSKPTTQVAVRGDCVKIVNGLKAKGQEIALGILDPPYNINQPYDAHKDDLTYDQYMAWASQWVGAVYDGLASHGSMAIFVPDEWVSEIDMLCKRQCGMIKRRHIIWAFTFGQAAQKNFTRSHCHILLMGKSKTKYTFNKEAVAVPSARQLQYNDKRAMKGGKSPDATWMLLGEQMAPYMTPDTDTWLESRICGTFKERKKHSPNQIPLPIMERLVAACTNPGELVFDGFAGTGGSGVACAKLGRNWIGADISDRCVIESNAAIAQYTKGTNVPEPRRRSSRKVGG